jgi:uncharacterized protein
MNPHVQVSDPNAVTLVLPKPAPQPVAQAERIAAIDVLRGVALLGILTMNVVAFAWPFAGYEDPRYSGGDDPANRAAWLVNQLVFSAKMMSLFSMLFGAGLVLMDARAKVHGTSLRGLFFRRTFWLLVFGLIHAYLIWMGDILVFYAICGFVVYFFRRLSPRWLIGLGAGLILFGTAIGLGMTLFAGAAERAALQVAADQAAGRESTEWQVGLAEAWHQGLAEFFRPNPEEIQREIEIYRGGYLGILRHRVPLVFFFQIFGLLFFMFWGIAGRMLLGMALMKIGAFTGTCSWGFYRQLAGWGYGFGLPLTVLGTLNFWQHQFDPLAAPYADTLLILGTVPMALGHAAVVMMICKAGLLPWLTRPLAAVGQMALTNYLLQSLICTTLFYGYGLGLFGRLDRVQLWLVVLAIWALQLALSPLWLKHFRYGPAEWLWRSLTYWKLQTLWRAA